MTSKELLGLAQKLGIGASSPSASIEDAQADRIRRRADADGLRREVQPDEPAKAAKATKATKATAATKAAAPAAPAAPPAPEVRAEPAPPVRAARVSTPPAPVVAPPTPESAPVRAEVPVAEAPKVVRSRAAAPKPTPTRAPSPDGPTTIRPTQRGAGADAEGGASTRPPLSSSGRPIPPPPGRPMSSSGRPIPPPPGARRPMSPGGPSRAPGATGSRPMSARPSSGPPRSGAVAARWGLDGIRRSTHRRSDDRCSGRSRSRGTVRSRYRWSEGIPAQDHASSASQRRRARADPDDHLAAEQCAGARW